MCSNEPSSKEGVAAAAILESCLESLCPNTNYKQGPFTKHIIFAQYLFKFTKIKKMTKAAMIIATTKFGRVTPYDI